MGLHVYWTMPATASIENNNNIAADGGNGASLETGKNGDSVGNGVGKIVGFGVG